MNFLDDETLVKQHMLNIVKSLIEKRDVLAELMLTADDTRKIQAELSACHQCARFIMNLGLGAEV